MSGIKIVGTGKYLPKQEIGNEEIEKQLGLEAGYIEKRTGIQKRYFVETETVEEMAFLAVENLLQGNNNQEEIVQDIGLIIVATTTPRKTMPGIANEIQKKLGISSCICLDILAGCSGFINAMDIAQLYLASKQVKKALVIGVDLLSQTTREKEIGTYIILSDGAGAMLLEEGSTTQQYEVYIESIPDKEDILVYEKNHQIRMKGKQIYKYAVTETVSNVHTLLAKAGESLEDISCLIPHQSNLKIMKSIEGRLGLKPGVLYTNLEQTGNTFCASIPIAFHDRLQDKDHKLKKKDKVIFLGYGGGLNTGSILVEI